MADEALLALRGRVVTMDDDDTVIDDGIVYIRGTHIAAVADEDDPPPAGFEGVRPRKVGGSIYPGLIDLHNHLSYDALPMWQVPDRYGNRDQWARHPDYRRLISGPMNVLGKTRGYPEAIARYAECKRDRKSTRLKSRSLMRISYAVFCLKKKTSRPKRLTYKSN